MANKTKKFVDYQDYLNSNKWKSLKQQFYDQYDGLDNTCEVSLFTFIGTPHLHHWRYSKNWNDDSIDNLILLDAEVHKWIHNNIKMEINAETKKEYIQSIQKMWFNDQYIRKNKILNLLNGR